LASARQLFEQALALYQRIEEPYSIGMTHRQLARITDGAARQPHVQAAREAWTGIDRPISSPRSTQEFGRRLIR